MTVSTTDYDYGAATPNNSFMLVVLVVLVLWLRNVCCVLTYSLFPAHPISISLCFALSVVSASLADVVLQDISLVDTQTQGFPSSRRRLVWRPRTSGRAFPIPGLSVVSDCFPLVQRCGYPAILEPHKVLGQSDMTSRGTCRGDRMQICWWSG